MVLQTDVATGPAEYLKKSLRISSAASAPTLRRQHMHTQLWSRRGAEVRAVQAQMTARLPCTTRALTPSEQYSYCFCMLLSSLFLALAMAEFLLATFGDAGLGRELAVAVETALGGRFRAIAGVGWKFKSYTAP